ncbi:hypothetical protein [Pseudoponticoccus marisrubri]|uniref:Uncharacterized protein n=1 Tax=Pseudoponticoccus marisrubri TaxID=1685382 RepID=A0A0W7WEY1_9RHOB|nr:hypothetical protein [Pseudoponticoccus marisrubri]KUF09038.1 hypothetical protein AVJ23_19780 [Pseudoponticoccus marisrubri]
MSKPSEFLCTERCIQHIEDAHLPLYGLRLVHACHYFVDQTPGLSMQNMALHPDRHYTVRCQTLLEATGTPNANDFDMIKEGVEFLQGGKIFSHLHLHENGRKLTFHFAKRYADDAVRKKGDKFAFVDVDQVRTLRTREQIECYMRATMVLRSDFPMFALSWREDRDGPWLQAKKSWLLAARRVGERLGLDFVIIPRISVETDEIDRVQVKLVPKVSRWSQGKLFPRDGQGVVVVVNGKSDTLSRAELRTRRNWCKADRP